MYEFTGKIKAVGELQTFASGFSKRELAVEEEREGNWPNVVAFAFKKDNVAKLDGVKPGMRVKVGFAVDGREWTDPKTGKVRYFSDLTATCRSEMRSCKIVRFRLWRRIWVRKGCCL